MQYGRIKELNLKKENIDKNLSGFGVLKGFLKRKKK